MRTYLDSAVEKQGLERFDGVYLTLPGCQHVVYRPNDKGRTVFRPYPAFDNGQEKPMRLEPSVYRAWAASPVGVTQDNAFYPWMTAEEMFSNAGVNGKLTCLAQVKGKDKRYVGPIKAFASAIRSAIKNNKKAFPEWEDWTEGQKKVLPPVDTVGMLQGMIFENQGKAIKDQFGRDNPQHPALLIVKKTAREALEQLGNAQNPDPNIHEEDFDKRFVNNQMVSCAQGKVIIITFHPQSGREISYYDVTVHPTPYPIPVQMAAQDWRPWESLLMYLTEEQQLELLLQSFPPESIDFVFGSSKYREMLPSGIVGKFDKMRNRAATVNGPSQPQYRPNDDSQPFQPTTVQRPAAPAPAAPPFQAPLPAAPVPAAAPAPTNFTASAIPADSIAASFGHSGVATPTPAASPVPVPALSLPPPPRVPGATNYPSVPSAPVAPVAAAPAQPAPWEQPAAQPFPPSPVAPAPVAATTQATPMPAAMMPAVGSPVPPPTGAPIGDPSVDHGQVGNIRSRLQAASAAAAAASTKP